MAAAAAAWKYEGEVVGGWTGGCDALAASFSINEGYSEWCCCPLPKTNVVCRSWSSSSCSGVRGGVSGPDEVPRVVGCVVSIGKLSEVYGSELRCEVG